jgi:hypothetical protein
LDLMFMPVTTNHRGATIADGEWSESSYHDANGSPTERLFDRVSVHLDEQHLSLVELQRLMRGIDHPVARFLMQGMAASKTGHRDVLARIAATLRDALHWTHSPDALPRTLYSWEDSPGRARATVKGLLRMERELGRDARSLARDYAGINGGLDALLLDMIGLDSQKHERVLRFVLRLLNSATGVSECERGAPDENRAQQVIERKLGLIHEPVRAPQAERVPLRTERDSWPETR